MSVMIVMRVMTPICRDYVCSCKYSVRQRVRLIGRNSWHGLDLFHFIDRTLSYWRRFDLSIIWLFEVTGRFEMRIQMECCEAEFTKLDVVWNLFVNRQACCNNVQRSLGDRIEFFVDNSNCWEECCLKILLWTRWHHFMIICFESDLFILSD